MYALLCGKLPFFEDDVKELYRKIAFANYEMPAYVSPCTWPRPLRDPSHGIARPYQPS